MSSGSSLAFGLLPCFFAIVLGATGGGKIPCKGGGGVGEDGGVIGYSFLPKLWKADLLLVLCCNLDALLVGFIPPTPLTVLHLLAVPDIAYS